MLESQFQKRLISKIKSRFADCIVLKNDPTYIQGIPDLLVLCGSKWAALEVKNDEKAHVQPNQRYYVAQMDEMSFARFIHPQNEEEVLDELEKILSP